MAHAIALEPFAEDTSSYFTPTTLLGCQLLWSDQLDEARPLFERSLRRAVQRGEEYDRGGVLYHLAHLEWEAGRLDAARGYTSEFGEVARELNDADADASLLWLQAFVAARCGNQVETLRRAEDAVAMADRVGTRWKAAYSTALLATAELWSGESEGSA